MNLHFKMVRINKTNPPYERNNDRKEKKMSFVIIVFIHKLDRYKHGFFFEEDHNKFSYRTPLIEPFTLKLTFNHQNKDHVIL